MCNIVSDSTINNELLMVVNLNVHIVDVYEPESENSNSKEGNVHMNIHMTCFVYTVFLFTLEYCEQLCIGVVL